jgi:EmrB/QacA subfamily drug resistance transporter
MEINGLQIRRAPIVASLLIAAFVALLGQTLLNVAIPTMMEDLGISENVIQWLITGYLLVNGILVPISAFLIERYTTRQLFIWATGLFTAGTLMCALAPGFELLLAGRLIQAAGAGILMPLMTVVNLTIFPVEQRGKAMGMMGLAMIFAPAIGPTLSGWIVEHYSWRVLFYILLPLTFISLVFGGISMKNITRLSSPKLDILGIIFSTIGFGGLLYGFSDAANEGWGSLPVIVSLSAGTLFLLLFIWRQFKVKIPILEFRVFKFDMFALTTVINVIITMAMFSGMILLPIFLQHIRGFTPLESGFLMLPGALLMGVVSPITGIIFDKIGARWLAVVGLLIMAATTFDLSRLTAETTYNHMLLIYTIRSFGMALMMMPIQTAGLNQLPQRLNAHGSAMSQTLRNIAGAVGTALLVTIFSNAAEHRGEQLILSAQINPQDPANAAQLAQIGQDATIYGINFAFEVSTWMTVAALLLAFFIRKTKPQGESKPAKEAVSVKPAYKH